MDYEKAYKEALERATKFKRQFLNNKELNITKRTINVFNGIFKELEEKKDDEKFMEDLIFFFSGLSKNDSWRGHTPDEWVAWLKEQWSKIPPKNANLEKELDKEWNKLYPKDEGMGLETANIVHEQFDNVAKHFYNLGFQNSLGWSEEDEISQKKVIKTLSAYVNKLQYEGWCANAEVVLRQIEWLKSIKEKFRLVSL